MANAAHITQNNQINPSIFEVTASDSLNAAFYPAIERLINVNNVNLKKLRKKN